MLTAYGHIVCDDNRSSDQNMRTIYITTAQKVKGSWTLVAYRTPLNSSSSWTTGPRPGRDQLGAPLARFVGGQAHGIGALRSDLARFTFLLGSNDGEQFFSPEH